MSTNVAEVPAPEPEAAVATSTPNVENKKHEPAANPAAKTIARPLQGRTRKPGQFYMEVRHDPSKDRDEGVDFVFSVEIAAQYPSLAELKSWDSSSTYLAAIVAKCARGGFDVTLPLTRDNFMAMQEKGKLTAPQASTIGSRVTKLLTHYVNGIMQRLDPSSSVQ